jgi:hypothetical protein
MFSSMCHPWRTWTADPDPSPPHYSLRRLPAIPLIELADSYTLAFRAFWTSPSLRAREKAHVRPNGGQRDRGFFGGLSKSFFGIFCLMRHLKGISVRDNAGRISGARRIAENWR